MCALYKMEFQKEHDLETFQRCFWGEEGYTRQFPNNEQNNTIFAIVPESHELLALLGAKSIQDIKELFSKYGIYFDNEYNVISRTLKIQGTKSEVQKLFSIFTQSNNCNFSPPDIKEISTKYGLPEWVVLTQYLRSPTPLDEKALLAKAIEFQYSDELHTIAKWIEKNQNFLFAIVPHLKNYCANEKGECKEKNLALFFANAPYFGTKIEQRFLEFFLFVAKSY